MLSGKLISGNSEEDIWHQISIDFDAQPDLLAYDALINYGDKAVNFEIDIDPGGGFEGGIESTTFTSELHAEQDFKFAMHHENFLDEIGKFFGMQDVETGYSEFDNKVMVKTNDKTKIKAFFEDAETRETFQGLQDYTFGITQHKTPEDVNRNYLELIIDEGILDIVRLQKIFHAFFKVLTSLDTSL